MSRLTDFLNTPVKDLVRQGFGKAPKTGDLYGIELECEGVRVDYDYETEVLLKDWTPHRDGSLRDIHGSSCEWIFNGPVTAKKSKERIEKLFDYFDGRKARLVTSNRTSTHVHFNMGDKNGYQVVNLFILHTILEDVLSRFCGDDRRGNLFCLSSRHAEEQVRWVQDAVFKQHNFGAFKEDWRYCSLNLASLNKFCTVEFRSMRGIDNRDDMLRWLNILDELCQYGCYTLKNPVDLLVEISNKTPEGFVRSIFSRENADLLLNGISQDDLNHSVYEGLRLVQMMCYRIGTEFDNVRLRGRDFWASFSEPEPVLDVDPAAVVPAMAKKPRRGIVQEVEHIRHQLGRAEPGIVFQQPDINQILADAAPAAPFGQIRFNHIRNEWGPIR